MLDAQNCQGRQVWKRDKIWQKLGVTKWWVPLKNLSDIAAFFFTKLSLVTLIKPTLPYGSRFLKNLIKEVLVPNNEYSVFESRVLPSGASISGGVRIPPKICIGGVQTVKDPPNKNGTCMSFIMNTNKVTFLPGQIFLAQNLENCISQR